MRESDSWTFGWYLHGCSLSAVPTPFGAVGALLLVCLHLECPLQNSYCNLVVAATALIAGTLKRWFGCEDSTIRAGTMNPWFPTEKTSFYCFPASPILYQFCCDVINMKVLARCQHHDLGSLASRTRSQMHFNYL